MLKWDNDIASENWLSLVTICRSIQYTTPNYLCTSKVDPISNLASILALVWRIMNIALVIFSLCLCERNIFIFLVLISNICLWFWIFAYDSFFLSVKQMHKVLFLLFLGLSLMHPGGNIVGMVDNPIRSFCFFSYVRWIIVEYELSSMQRPCIATSKHVARSTRIQIHLFCDEQFFFFECSYTAGRDLHIFCSVKLSSLILY